MYEAQRETINHWPALQGLNSKLVKPEFWLGCQYIANHKKGLKVMVVFMTSLYQKLNNLIDLNRLQKFRERVALRGDIENASQSVILWFGVWCPWSDISCFIKTTFLVDLHTNKMKAMRTEYRPHSTFIRWGYK